MRRALAVLLVPAMLCAQQEGSDPKARRPFDPERAEALLRAHGKNSAKVAVLVADYVQRRTTALSKKPLVSSGAFLFVREPGCVLFRASKPRPSVVRLTAQPPSS